MHVKRVDLYKFKQFKKSDISIKPGLTLVVGGNNAGKSSILHALAVWEFCKTLLQYSRGLRAWTSDEGGSTGIGIGISEFSPISVPTLRHLWTDLKTQRTADEADGYTLRVKAVWDALDGTEQHLEFGLSLANDRLFIKRTSSSLKLADVQAPDGKALLDVAPRVAFLPPFAGITDKEARHSFAARSRLIGQGLSGGVIRNVLYDMWQSNRNERQRLRGEKSKIGGADLKALRANDPWELLLRALAELFQVGLTVEQFDDRYHTHLQIETFRGKLDGPTLKKAPTDVTRDLMVEGSGFLQWLSVYALALSPETDVILLDEPDAHLHCSLQLELVRYLSDLAESRGKQVLLATHSTELIRNIDHHSVMKVQGGKANYLAEEAQKVGILAGIGTAFAPKLHALTQSKRLLIVEGSSDVALLKIWSKALGLQWPKNVVVWQWSGKPKERRQLFLQLRQEIPELEALGIRDRDDEEDGTVGPDLVDKQNPPKDGFTALKWRRRHIENYLIHPAAIARAYDTKFGPIVDEDVVKQMFAETHGLAVPADPTVSDVVLPMRDARGKEIFTDAGGICKTLTLTRHEIASAMATPEVPADIETFLTQLALFAKEA